MDWVIVCVGLVVFHICLSLWLFRQIVFTLHAIIGQLDSSIGEAVQKLVEGGLGDMEPINPIQQAIAQMLTKNLNQPTIEAVIQDRGTDGKFAQQ